MSVDDKLNELIERHLRAELSEPEMEQLAKSLDSDSAARRAFVDEVQWDTRFAEVLRGNDQSSETPRETTTRIVGRNTTLLLGAAILAVAASLLIAIPYFRVPNPNNTVADNAVADNSAAENTIAKITGIDGPLLWTGDGGRLDRNLQVGTELSGGTIEGMTPDSWFELEFHDGSTVTLSGTSMLTFSDLDQKRLRLREGSFSANVAPQPEGKPMLVHTRSAVLKVIGTKFEVEAELDSTVLDVSEGRVQVTRRRDGNNVEVPAGHRLITAVESEMSPARLPDSVYRWKSQLHLSPHGTYGHWSPATSSSEAMLKTIPHTTEQQRTIYAIGINVSLGDRAPVVIRPNSRIRVRGRLGSKHGVWFGLTLRHANGDFAGKFQTTRPGSDFEAGEEFDVLLELADYKLDPSLEHIREHLPSDPYNLIVESIWSHTLYDRAGMAVTEVELIDGDNWGLFPKVALPSDSE